MADLDPGARRVARSISRGSVVKARQFVLDRSQRLEHLPRQKLLGPLLRLGNRQHALLPPATGGGGEGRNAARATGVASEWQRPPGGPRPP